VFPDGQTQGSGINTRSSNPVRYILRKVTVFFFRLALILLFLAALSAAADIRRLAGVEQVNLFFDEDEL
jgi:hypothetical protein